jgi:hypothetical protein
MTAMSLLLKLLAAIGPLLLTVFFAWLVMEGYLDFGGGGKDVLLVLPLLLWSLVYLGCYLTLWWRRFRQRRLLAWSAGLATGFVAVAWLILLLTVAPKTP